MDLDAGLRALGYEAFKEGQREAIETLLEERRLLLVAPTGGGKSLTYQLPGSLLPGTTLVVSPLIALMHDQVQALQARGVEATFLASTLGSAELRGRMADMGQGRYKLVYVAPERLAFGGFRDLLGRIECPLIAIDEAHCISEWGHDFRPDYMQLGELLASLPEARVLACTATATPVVRDEILARLGLGPETPQMLRGFARPNLALRAADVRSAVDRRALVDGQLAEALGEPGAGRGAAIVYSPTRRKSEDEHHRLQDAGWRSACYHAGRPAAERERVSRTFSDGSLEVVVATNAFGMGIDRADVRAVIHLAPPGSIEAYYQEVGRAGRDDERAWGLLLTSAQDMPLRRRLLEAEIDGRAPDPAVVDHKWNLFLELMRWTEGGSCRHDAILRYFGVEETDELKGCGICDVCQSFDAQEQDPEEVTLIARKALSGVARVHDRLGLTAAAKLLHGSVDDRLQRFELDQVSTYGALADRPEAWILRLLRRCVTAGWVNFTTGDRPLALLTREGREVMYGRRPARLLLPPAVVAASARARKHTKAKRAEIPALDTLDPAARELFEVLRAHRLQRANTEGVPPFMVASDRTLRDLASMRPTSRAQLLLVHGIGPSKVEKYGDGFLHVVAQSDG